MDKEEKGLEKYAKQRSKDYGQVKLSDRFPDTVKQIHTETHTRGKTKMVGIV